MDLKLIFKKQIDISLFFSILVLLLLTNNTEMIFSYYSYGERNLNSGMPTDIPDILSISFGRTNSSIEEIISD